MHRELMCNAYDLTLLQRGFVALTVILSSDCYETDFVSHHISEPCI